jgi:hypothetical protein
MTKADSMTKQLALLDVFSMDDSLTGQLFSFISIFSGSNHFRSAAACEEADMEGAQFLRS